VKPILSNESKKMSRDEIDRSVASGAASLKQALTAIDTMMAKHTGPFLLGYVA
jgi:hypothetical protein